MKPVLLSSFRLGICKFGLIWAVVLACCAASAAPPETRARGTVQEITVHGRSLEGNLDNDPPDRQVSVYLPPSYSRDTKRRYPVIYFLHDFNDTNAKWFGAERKGINLRDLLDRTIANGTVKEMIAVVPNAYTRFQGSFYSNSIVTGNWEDFIASDLVHYIDTHYRTLASAESRGLAGHSMGGYGAIRIGMKHPDVFGSIYAMSACCLIWGGDFQPTGAVNLKIQSIHTETALAQADVPTLATFAQAAAWSPNPDNPPFYVDFPGQANGTSRPEIVAKWSANLPLAFIDQYRRNLERLHAIAFDVGDQDDFAHVPLGAKQLDAVLNEYHVPHTFEEYPGTHTSAIPERIETKVLPFFTKNLVFGPVEKAAPATK
jgi:S-formylglutathione hydrolase FrmB